MATTASPPFTLDAGTAFSLAVAFSLMPSARALAAVALPKSIKPTYYYLFLWHAYDFLTHFIIEGSYLYHCFFSYIDLPIPTSDYPHPASRGGPPVPQLFGHSDRRYGAIYSQAPMARLWQEYAKADRRWGGADLTVISLEILTVGLAGPAAMVAKSGSQSTAKAKYQTRMWFVAVMIATGELYGGFMTFAPEWLSGNPALAGEDPVYLWLYLVFFNMLWVFIPLWVLYAAYTEISAAFTAQGVTSKKSN
ncbi:uncharacterized protein A1O9_04734 [Exophiala aquamarina CBS 119918]|uniref:EXPERA domain-containing protein n=1 Tax=Exophiala aquamarina CBS 119918 TaxID=1182545 RepID=A0A072PJ32_9EURO|nr:uncharacterized protein A1O9_04734 [Exophiala aquamarina CBS 119918]KEF59886.1 hypothetical protein A1O9_04734 [Exophiala aquamarina CBS 119918]